MSLAVKAARAQAMGDPGLFGSIGKFLGGAAKIVGGILPGPIGLGLRAAGGLLAPTRRAAPAPVAVQRGRPGGFGRFAAPQVTRPGAMLPAAQRAERVGAGIACPAGFKPNKSDYFLKDGSFVPAGSKCVRVRRRNPLNVRAADRAIGRIESAKKAVTRLNRVTVRKACPHK